MNAPVRKLFGTDGIRGNADVDLTPDLVREIGRAVAVASRDGGLGARTERPRFVIGRDTRLSGPKLEHAFGDGACAAGADVLLAGVLPTAGVAFLTALLGFDGGIVISASHNPAADNGVKLFGPGGWKLPEQAEATIESLVGTAEAGDTEAGEVHELSEALEAYTAHLTSAAPHDVRGMRVVIDCANGSAVPVAPALFQQLGVDVTVLNGEADGSKINEGCGALHPEIVAAAAAERGAIGVTFDGDADRVLIADEEGRLVGGDAILALLASDYKNGGHLRNDSIVVTVMANQALRRWCAEQDIHIIETPVGDRHVLEAMRSKGVVLGGEQSGHIVCLDRSTTGDGILVALHVLDVVASSGRRLADLIPFQPFPQVLVNVKTTKRDGIESNEAAQAAIAKANETLGDGGRVLVRSSGTEPLVRVMVEATDASVAHRVADDVAAVVRAELGEHA